MLGILSNLEISSSAAGRVRLSASSSSVRLACILWFLHSFIGQIVVKKWLLKTRVKRRQLTADL